MRRIFVSYRREDAEGEAGRLFDDLVHQFGEGSVFLDVAAIEVGRDFRKAIDESVSTCSVLLAIVGRDWVEVKDERVSAASKTPQISSVSKLPLHSSAISRSFLCWSMARRCRVPTSCRMTSRNWLTGTASS